MKQVAGVIALVLTLAAWSYYLDHNLFDFVEDINGTKVYFPGEGTDYFLGYLTDEGLFGAETLFVDMPDLGMFIIGEVTLNGEFTNVQVIDSRGVVASAKINKKGRFVVRIETSAISSFSLMDGDREISTTAFTPYEEFYLVDVSSVMEDYSWSQSMSQSASP